MNQKDLEKVRIFRKVSLITVFAVYLLILVGGIVRSTGSGMGCPDWPKCFGKWVPPTDVMQLPDNYQEVYSNKRIEKNERFVAMLHSLGFDNKAEEIKNDKSILIEQEFNPTKTWIEYVNRLLGAVIGLLIIITFLYSFPLWKWDRNLVMLCFFNILLVIFQGWIGSIVVSTNLIHWMITFHMFLALLLVCLILYVHYRSYKLAYPVKVKTAKPGLLYLILMISFVMTNIQVVLGTQVREQLDIVSAQFGNLFRSEWVGHLGEYFLIHRSFSIVLLIMHVVFIYSIYKHSFRRSNIFGWSQLLVFMVLLEIVTGIGLSYFSIPAFLQPVHLFVGALVVGIQFIILLILNDQRRLVIKYK